MKDILLQRRN